MTDNIESLLKATLEIKDILEEMNKKLDHLSMPREVHHHYPNPAPSPTWLPGVWS